jgi:Terminase large subunit, T4likevirus-type, N-terminal
MASLAADLGLALNPHRLMQACGLTPEAWQERVLRTRPQRALLCCCRQAGKSVTAAAASLHEALYSAGSLILMLAPSQRQSGELLRTTRALLDPLAATVTLTSVSTHSLEFANGSRIVSLPAREDTIRGFSKVALIAIDEAAWVEDELYLAVRPMLAVSAGRLLALSTPNGQRGWFHRAWTSSEPWQRTRITADQCPRISASFLADERRTQTATRYASEYECEFTDAIDSVFRYEDVTAALDPTLAPLFPEGW